MFGNKFIDNFVHEENLTNLNHGASGMVCKPAFEAQIAKLQSKAAFPDNYYSGLRTHTNLRVEERKALAEILDANVEDVVLCQGATTAVNAILWSFPWAKGDKVLIMSTIFHNCMHTLEFIVKQFDIELVTLPIQYPVSDPDLVAQFREALDAHKPRMALFDVVSSTPSVYFPWEDMCKACNDRGVVSLVDGAHGIGLVPVSLRTAKPSFWLSNIHKWFWVSQSAGVLYVDPEFQQGIQSLPISMISPNDTGADRFARSFSYSSTLDYTALDGILAAAALRKSVGEDKIIEYQNELAASASKYICEQWNVTEIIPLARRQAMFTVRCPLQPQDQAGFCKFVADRLFEKHGMFIPVFPSHGKLWIRFSAAVYLELSDFEVGKKALDECFAACQ